MERGRGIKVEARTTEMWAGGGRDVVGFGYGVGCLGQVRNKREHRDML